MWWKSRPKRNPKPLWIRGEDAAARFLQRAGYRILERNVRLGRNEIDIIAQDGDTTVFVEVRTRATLDDVPPEDTIGPVKQAHLRQAARHYLLQHGREHYYRFDVVAILLPDGEEPTITHFPDAFPGV